MSLIDEAVFVQGYVIDDLTLARLSGANAVKYIISRLRHFYIETQCCP